MIVTLPARILGRKLTFKRTQRENGKVTTTISQEMQKRTHPRNPRPGCLFLDMELAAKKYSFLKDARHKTSFETKQIRV